MEYSKEDDTGAWIGKALGVGKRLLASIRKNWREGSRAGNPAPRYKPHIPKAIPPPPPARPIVIMIDGVDPALPDYCRHGHCSRRCIAASRATYEAGYDAEKLGALFEAIEKLSRGNPYRERITKYLEDPERLQYLERAQRVVDAFDDLRMED